MKKKTTEYKISCLTLETGKCAGHHFARATCEASRRVSDEHTVTYYDENVVGEGIAKRTSKDRNDEYVGQNLALARALESLAAKVMRRANGKVRHNDDMKLQRANKRSRVVVGIDLAELECVEVKNLRTVGKAYEAMFGDSLFKDTVDMVVCDDVEKDLENLEDTHFEDDDETERLIDEC